MINRTIKRALIGFVIGMVVGDIISVVFTLSSGDTMLSVSQLIARYASNPKEFLIHTLLSGVHGAISMAGVSFYEIEDWGLLKTAVVHYLLIITSYTVIGLYLDWLPPSFWGIVISWTYMGVIYLIIWLIMNARYKAEVKELNEILEKDKEGSEK